MAEAGFPAGMDSSDWDAIAFTSIKASLMAAGMRSDEAEIALDAYAASPAGAAHLARIREERRAEAEARWLRARRQ